MAGVIHQGYDCDKDNIWYSFEPLQLYMGVLLEVQQWILLMPVLIFKTKACHCDLLNNLVSVREELKVI